MGIGPSYRSCYTNASQPAPNPDPSRWKLLDKVVFPNAYALLVQYLDCTNFEGKKVLVFRGEYTTREYLDPHFTTLPNGPIARFRPDAEGLEMAKDLAKRLGSGGVR